MLRSQSVIIILLLNFLKLANAQELPNYVLIHHSQVLDTSEAVSEGYFERGGRWLEKRWKKKEKTWDRLDKKHSSWTSAQRTESKHYRILSNLPSHILDTEIKPFLDALYVSYAKLFKDEFGLSAKAADNKFIHIHKSLEDYATHTGGRSPEMARFNPGFIENGSVLVVYYDESDHEVFYNTVMHESAHQFMHAMFPGATFPLWITEGMATYFEGCRYSRSATDFIIGDLPAARLLSAQASLEANPEASMKELFLGKTGPRFGAREYALAWSFIHFLNHGDGGKWKKSFVKFLKEMNGAGVRLRPSEIFEKISGKHFVELEAPWKEHLRSLRAERRYWVVGILGSEEDLEGTGLEAGDILTHLNGQLVANARHFQELSSALEAEAPVDLIVSRSSRDQVGRFGLRISRQSGFELRVVDRESRDGSLID